MYEYLRRREMEKKNLAWLIYAFILTLHHLWFETSWLFLTFPVITMCWLPLTLFNKKNYFRVAWCDVFNSILHQLLHLCTYMQHLPSLFPPNHWPEKQFLKGYSEKMIFHLHSIWWKKHFSKYSEMWHSIKKINK